MRIIKSTLHKIEQSIKRYFPRWQAERLYRKQFHRAINWHNPTEFNEKLRWLQFNTDTSKWSLLADKYLVRGYLEKLGYGDLLVKLYGVWNNAEDIDFSKLPDKFVLKTNHGCGGVFVIEDKTTVDREVLIRKLNQGLRTPFGIESSEPHYWKIKPVIIAEELIEQDGDFSTSLVDYKFYCVYGEPIFCGVMYNRDIKGHTYDIKLYDATWNDISNLLGEYDHTRIGEDNIPSPVHLEEMLEFCNKNCKEFPFVRMDFYECNGKFYFGEFTFTPAACTGAPLGLKACELLSGKIDLKLTKI